MGILFIIVILIAIAAIVILNLPGKRGSKGNNEGYQCKPQDKSRLDNDDTYWSNMSCPKCRSHYMKSGYGARRQCSKCGHVFSS
jgi:transcription initiation factor IIE alpha subunit